MSNHGNTSSHPYRYILRYQIVPGYAASQRIEELVTFCRSARVEEVMLFFNAEEMADGHITREEIEPWLAACLEAKKALADAGVEISLNPWTTTYHVARGSWLKPGQDFTLMVGETGGVAGVSACPLCPNWQAYLADLFAHACEALEPVALWIEDDWRLHNHDPNMGYGGCFCQLHLAKLAEKLGIEKVTRQDVLEHILAPDEPDAWRKAWMDVCCDSICRPAETVAQEVCRRAPNTRIALMSSDPDVHSIEGRNWLRLQEALGRNPDFLIRPHLPPYAEAPALTTPPSVTRHTLANLSRPIGVYPELDNGPRLGPYSKSRTYTKMQILESVCYGSRGITINHFSNTATGTALDPLFDCALSEPKMRLNALMDLHLDDADAQGAAVLFSPRVAETIQTTHQTPEMLYQLCNSSRGFADVLSILGFSYAFICDVQTLDSGRPVFVCDQTLRAFSDADIEQLLRGVLICDPTSLEILHERGFAKYTGIDSGTWGNIETSGHRYETILCDDPSVYGVTDPRVSSLTASDAVFFLEPQGETTVLSTLHTATGTELGAAATMYQNELGGRVVATAYPVNQAMFLTKPQSLNLGYFTVFRQRFWRAVLFGSAPPGACLTSSLGVTPLRVYRNGCTAGTFVGIVNPTLDQAADVQLRFSDLSAEPGSVLQLTPEGTWIPANVDIIEHKVGQQDWNFYSPISPHDVLYLLDRS